MVEFNSKISSTETKNSFRSYADHHMLHLTNPQSFLFTALTRSHLSCASRNTNKRLGTSRTLRGTTFTYARRMRLAYATTKTRIPSSKSFLRQLYDICVQRDKCRSILKRVLKPCERSSLEVF